MRQPLDEFAERLIRSGELVEFLNGLMNEKGIDPVEIIRIAQRVYDEKNAWNSKGPWANDYRDQG